MSTRVNVIIGGGLNATRRALERNVEVGTTNVRDLTAVTIAEDGIEYSFFPQDEGLGDNDEVKFYGWKCPLGSKMDDERGRVGALVFPRKPEEDTFFEHNYRD